MARCGSQRGRLGYIAVSMPAAPARVRVWWVPVLSV